jgi:hypothetical protein
MKTLLFSISLVLLAGFAGVACKSNKLSKNTSNEYRLIVSFLSKGSGIDMKVHESFLSFTDKHSKKPKYEIYRWGREGEIDYCFQLGEMKAKDQSEFIESVKNIIGKSDEVQILENSPCVHKK